jgi:hypothetical protein
VTSDCNRYCCGGGPLTGAETPAHDNASRACRKIAVIVSTDTSGSIVRKELIGNVTILVSGTEGV